MNAADPPSTRSLRGLDWINFFLADVQTGVGPFLAIFLASRQWNEQRVGIALTVGGLAGIAAQTPAGALVDRLRAKRTLIAVGIVGVCVGAVLIPLVPNLPCVLFAQTIIGAVSSVFNPAVAAVTLGLVGYERFDRRQGRNQSWNSAGNVAAALSMGWIGWRFGAGWIFGAVVGWSLPAILSLLLIRADEIDYELARGACDGDGPTHSRFRELFRDRPLLIFLACAVLFHFANAAMLPLLGEMLARGRGRSSPLFMAACVIITQAVIAVIAWPVGRLAGVAGRKPLLLIGFAALPVRGLLYTLTRDPRLLIAIQVLDGIGAGIFGVVSVLVIADRTRGTGRFNAAQGGVFTAVGIGASLSQTVAGTIVHHGGDRAGFLFLAAVAAVAWLILWMLMPETLDTGDPHRVAETGVARI